MTVQRDIERLFDRYLQAWNARDFESIGDCFAEPIVYMLPTGPLCLPDRAAFLDMLRNLFARLEADGFDHTEIASVTARQCNDTTAIVDLKDVRRLRADGSAIEEIDAIYFCLLKDGEWKLSIAVGCWSDWSTG